MAPRGLYLCTAAAARTGAVIGAYHIDHDGWDNARALADAKAHKMAFFQFPRENYILHFQARTLNAKSDTPAATVPVVAIASSAGATN